MTTETIQSMTLPEQIEAMERLWDSICHTGKEPDSPAWHEGVIRERQERYQSGEAETLSLNQVKKRFGR
ncbi:MAG: addiction module protein [Verrucomicrobia bacterium]|nr:addiction module protein [Verrucomicrobiota bacterium]MCH8526543.1 addiction module protein [Kiritimatiellia bacterium]